MRDYEVLGDGSSRGCLTALAGALEREPEVLAAVFVSTRVANHWNTAILLGTEDAEFPRPRLVGGGFTMGYGGEGPWSSGLALQMLDELGLRPRSREVTQDEFEELCDGRMTYERVNELLTGKAGNRGPNLYDLLGHYLEQFERPGRTWEWAGRPEVYAFASPGMWKSASRWLRQDPDRAVLELLIEAEQKLRERLGSLVDEPLHDVHGTHLVGLAFGQKGRLCWPGMPVASSEHHGRFQFLQAVFLMLRNPRAHGSTRLVSEREAAVQLLMSGEALEMIESAEEREG